MSKRDQQPDPTPTTKPARQEPPPRLISFGTRKITIQGRHGRPDQEVEFESAYDVAHPCDIYYRQVGTDDPWQPKDVDNRPTNKVIESGIFIRRHDPKQDADAGDKRDVITRFPPLSEAQRAAAEVLRGVVSEH